jgi:DNA-binding transcriptional LysR family regulator
VIFNLVESGVGVSLVRDEAAAQSIDAGRSVIWPGSQVTTRLWLVQLENRTSDPLLAALTDVLHDVWVDGFDTVAVRAAATTAA